MAILFYSVSPALAVVFVAFAVASLASVFTAPYGFATLSNLCLILSALWREFAAIRGRSTSAVAGELTSGTFPLLLLGVASLSFHRSHELASPAHTLDVFAGWVLVSHLGFCAVKLAAIAVPQLLGWPPFYRTLLGSLLSVGFAGAVAALAVLFDEVYAHQLLFYLIVGSNAVLFGALCRALLAGGEEGAGVALFELFVALAVVTAAIFAQGELIGRTLTAATAPELYDLFHGLWHVLLSAVATLVYARVADLGRLLETPTARCVCALPVLDWLGEALLLLLAVVVLVTKEAAADVVVARALIGGCTGLGALHATATIVVHWNARIDFSVVESAAV